MRCKGRWFHCWHYVTDTKEPDRCKASGTPYGTDKTYHVYRCCVCRVEKQVPEQQLDYGGY